ncbi:MAG: hypothetical protein R3C12_11865 [Planctomycetaceae bacterium]
MRACLLRQARLWSPLPMGPEARELPRFAGWVLIGFYGAVYGLACVGLVRILSHRAARAAVWPGLALVLTLTCVHLFFWTNARMRAPIMPVLAVWAEVHIGHTATASGSRSRYKSHRGEAT